MIYHENYYQCALGDGHPLEVWFLGSRMLEHFDIKSEVFTLEGIKTYLAPCPPKCWNNWDSDYWLTDKSMFAGESLTELLDALLEGKQITVRMNGGNIDLEYSDTLDEIMSALQDAISLEWSYLIDGARTKGSIWGAMGVAA